MKKYVLLFFPLFSFANASYLTQIITWAHKRSIQKNSNFLFNACACGYKKELQKKIILHTWPNNPTVYVRLYKEKILAEQKKMLEQAHKNGC